MEIREINKFVSAISIAEITNKNIWEDFLASCKDKTFLQSWNWGEFQEKMRGKIWRFGVHDNGQIIALSLVVKVAARRGTFLLLPHGPITPEQSADQNEIMKILLKKLKELAKNENCDFIRVNPIWRRSEKNNAIFRDLKFRPSPIQMHPEASWKLDITPSEEALLVNMRKTTRYLIKQAIKNQDIRTSRSVDMKDVEVFSQMHSKVSLRQHFVPFSLEYLKTEFATFKQDDEIIIFFGKYKNQLAAASFVVFWSGIGFYHHAASFPEFAKIPVPYLLQWEAMKEAKKRGCVLYDFWGYVDPQSKHPWAGPTLFKMGFGGSAHEYVKTQDYPLSKKYWLTYLFEMIRKIKRGL